MKKVMFGLAAAAAIAAFGIESANVVGYTTKTITSGKLMMVAVQFDKVGGAQQAFNEAFEINDEAKTVLAWDSEENEIPGWTAEAPSLRIPYGTVNMGYRNLYYTANAWDDDNGCYTNGWADMYGFLVTDATMLSDYGVWLVAGTADLTVTIKGEVKAAASGTISGATGYNMLKLPFPVALNAVGGKIDWNLSGKGVAAWDEAADEGIDGWTATAPALKIPYGTVNMGYRNLYYSSNAWDDDNGEYVEGWADMYGFLATDAVIPEGQAFWFVVPSATTATVTK